VVPWSSASRYGGLAMNRIIEPRYRADKLPEANGPERTP
jgi:hypothetical protein